MIKSEQLIIFDCDGILVDSEIIANKVEVAALNDFGYAISIEESIRKFTGMNAKTAREYIFAESGIDLPEDFFEVMKPAILHALEQELEQLMFPVLSSAILQDVSICVASNSPRERVLKSLQVTGQKDFFLDQHVFTSSQVANGKPAPDLFLFAAEKMGYHPKNCIVIEDSAVGIEAAIAAGMSVIAFLGGSHTKFSWYVERISGYNTKVVNNTKELLLDLSVLLKKENTPCAS